MNDERWPIGHPGVSDPDEDEKWVRAYEQQHERDNYYPTDMEAPWDDEDDGEDVDEETIQAKGCEGVGWFHFWQPAKFDSRFERCDVCRHIRKCATGAK